MSEKFKLKLEEYMRVFKEDETKALFAVIADALCEISTNTENITNKMYE